MLLSDEEIHEDYKALRGDKQPRYIEIYRAAEAAILAKLASAELPPLPAYECGPHTGHAAVRTDESIRAYGLQAHAQGFAAGAASQLAEKPIGWFVKEHGDVVDLEWNSEKPKYEGDWKPLYTRREAK